MGANPLCVLILYKSIFFVLPGPSGPSISIADAYLRYVWFCQLCCAAGVMPRWVPKALISNSTSTSETQAELHAKFHVSVWPNRSLYIQVQVNGPAWLVVYKIRTLWRSSPAQNSHIDILDPPHIPHEHAPIDPTSVSASKGPMRYLTCMARISRPFLACPSPAYT